MEKRNRQINIRLTDDERDRISEHARQSGLSLSDYVRVSALVLGRLQLGSKLT